MSVLLHVGCHVAGDIANWAAMNGVARAEGVGAGQGRAFRAGSSWVLGGGLAGRWRWCLPVLVGPYVACPSLFSRLSAFS